MNYYDIKKECCRIYANRKADGREQKPEDGVIFEAIIRLYNTTEIDHEEVKWLWVSYLDTGNLYLAEAIEMARVRIAYAIRKQRIEWLDK